MVLTRVTALANFPVVLAPVLIAFLADREIVVMILCNSISESSSGYYEMINSQLTYTAEVNWKMLTRAGFEM